MLLASDTPHLEARVGWRIDLPYERGRELHACGMSASRPAIPPARPKLRHKTDPPKDHARRRGMATDESSQHPQTPAHAYQFKAAQPLRCFSNPFV
jgi:hypothetical protein